MYFHVLEIQFIKLSWRNISILLIKYRDAIIRILYGINFIGGTIIAYCSFAFREDSVENFESVGFQCLLGFIIVYEHEQQFLQE